MIGVTDHLSIERAAQRCHGRPGVQVIGMNVHLALDGRWRGTSAGLAPASGVNRSV
jgi:hypothetical protein